MTKAKAKTTKQDIEDQVDENEGTTFEEEAGETVDLSGVDENEGFEVLPKGVYSVIVESAEYKKSQAGNQMISLMLGVEDGEYANRKLFTNIVFSPKSNAMAKGMIKALGLQRLIESPFNPADPEFVAEFNGARARAQVTIEKYEDRDQNRVKGLKVATEGGNFLDDDSE